MSAISLPQLAAALADAWRRAAAAGCLRAPIAGGGELAVASCSLAGEPAFTLRQPDGATRRLALGPRRTVGRFAVQLNQARPLRPPPTRARCGFACDDPRAPLSIVERTPRLTLAALDLAFLPQAFPIDPGGHWLIVPWVGGRLAHRRQHLQAADVAALLQVAAAAPDALLFYNTLAAGGGSVDHLHAQILTRFPPLPLERLAAPPRALAPIAGWPAGGLWGAADASALTAAVLRLQAAGVAFNLLLRGGVAVLAGRPRRRAETVDVAVGALELGGLFLFADPAVLAAQDEASLATALRETTLPVEHLRAAIGG